MNSINTPKKEYRENNQKIGYLNKEIKKQICFHIFKNRFSQISTIIVLKFFSLHFFAAVKNAYN